MPNPILTATARAAVQQAMARAERERVSMRCACDGVRCYVRPDREPMPEGAWTFAVAEVVTTGGYPEVLVLFAGTFPGQD